MAKLIKLTEQQMADVKKRFSTILEYSYITKPENILLDEDEVTNDVIEPNGEVDVTTDSIQQPEAEPTQPTEEPQINTEVNPELPPIENTEIQPEVQGSLEVEPKEGEVEIDITQLTDQQGKISDKVEDMIKKSGEIFDVLNQLSDKIQQQADANNEKIESLKQEIEKRNPTSVEKLQKRVAISSPFNQTPENYWDEKQEEGGYELVDDDNLVNDKEEYIVKASDIEDNAREVYKSIGNPSDYNQSLKSLLGY